jgi:hypothetical protein
MERLVLNCSNHHDDIPESNEEDIQVYEMELSKSLHTFVKTLSVCLHIFIYSAISVDTWSVLE